MKTTQVIPRAARAMAMAALCAPALAGETVHHVVVPRQPTDWAPDRKLFVPQHDATLGPIHSMTITGRLKISRRIGVENVGPQPGPIQISNLTAFFRVMSPTGGPDPLPPVSFDLKPIIVTTSGFDGAIDFDGTSGFQSEWLHSVSQFHVEFDAREAAPYVGIGCTPLPLRVEATSSVTGPGNVVADFDSFGTLNATVVYNWGTLEIDGDSGVESPTTASADFGRRRKPFTPHWQPLRPQPKP